MLYGLHALSPQERYLYMNEETDSGARTVMEEPATGCQGPADCGGMRTTWNVSRWLHWETGLIFRF